MIDRIPQRAVPQLIGLLRASTRKPSYLSNTSCMRADIWPRQPRCLSHKRFYASPPTHNFRGPSSTDPGFEHSQTQASQYEQLNTQYNPSYTTLPPRSQQQYVPFPPPPPPPRRKRSLRPYIWATTFFLFGSLAGHYIRLVVIPPEQPLPGSHLDTILIQQIHERAAQLPIVQALSNDPAWRSWDAYSMFTYEERKHRITTGPLGGARGLGGYQRIFHNTSTGDFISVVWIGGALSGWPGVAHGGLLATLLDECLGRCAIARFAPEFRTGVTAKLEMDYRAPVATNAFYVVRAMRVPEGFTERKSYVKGTVERLDGTVCVEAGGLFVVPKNIHEKALKPVELRNLDVGF